MFLLELIRAAWREVRAMLTRQGPRGSKTRRHGDRAEDFALRLLERDGFTLLVRNLGDSSGELDLVGRQAGHVGIVVVEVRARREGSPISPREAVDWRKRRQVIRTARRLLREVGLRGRVRYDIVGVWTDEAGNPLRAERFAAAFGGRRQRR